MTIHSLRFDLKQASNLKNTVLNRAGTC